MSWHSTRQKLRLVCDIDDVLADAWGDYFKELRRRFGRVITQEEVAAYGYIQEYPWTDIRNELWAIMEGYRRDPSFVGNHSVIEGAREALLEIIEDNAFNLVFYLTGRPRTSGIIEATFLWLRKNGFPFRPVIFRPTGLSHSEYPSWKKQMLEKHRIDVVIDDNPDLAQEGGFRLILLQRPFTEGLNVPAHPNIHRASSWTEVTETLRKIKEHHFGKL